MVKRLVTGFTLAGAAIGILAWGNRDAIAAVFILVAVLSAWELHTMVVPKRRLEGGFVSLLVGAVLAGLHGGYTESELYGMLVGFFGFSLLVVFKPDPIEGAVKRLAAMWLALLYVGVPFSLGISLVDNPSMILLLCVVVFGADTGAFFAGRSLGKHKLYEKLSPKKTIEGAIGGVLASMGLAALIKIYLPLDLSWETTVALGIGGSILGIVGDLV